MSKPYGEFKEGATYNSEQNFVKEYYFNKFINNLFLSFEESILIFFTINFLF